MLDRPGLRWALRLCSPYPIVVIVHRGRRTGRLYRTPLELLAGGVDGSDMFVLPLFGHKSDWYRNVVAGGLVEGSFRGRRGPLDWRRATPDEARSALEAYRHKHSAYTRVLLRIVAGVNELPGASTGDLAEALPVVVMQFRIDGLSS